MNWLVPIHVPAARITQQRRAGNHDVVKGILIFWITSICSLAIYSIPPEIQNLRLYNQAIVLTRRALGPTVYES